MKENYNNLIEYIGITTFIDEYYEVFTEKSIENYITIKNNDMPIKEVAQVFVSCDILEHKLVTGFNGQSVDGSSVSENICFIQGSFNLSIQYIDAKTGEMRNVSNNNEYFSTFITIPEECALRGDIVIKGYITNAQVAKINSHQLFYYIQTIIALSIY